MSGEADEEKGVIFFWKRIFFVIPEKYNRFLGDLNMIGRLSEIKKLTEFQFFSAVIGTTNTPSGR